MRIIIHDASVLIDLVSMEILNEALSLPDDMAVPDLVVHEIVEPRQREALGACIQDRRFRVLPLNGDELAQAALMRTQMSGLSMADCSVILKAQALSGMILSGDMRLRKQATALGFEVHGSLWVVEQLFTHGALTSKDACVALTTLENSNSRIPKNECRALKERIERTE